MCRPPLLPITATLVSTLALGCSDQQQPPTDPADDERGPSLSAEHVKDAPVYFFMGGEPSNPFVLLAGLPPGGTAADLCNGSVAPGDIGDLRGQFILTPPGGSLYHEQGRNANFVVYEYGGGIVTDPCQFAQSPILGTGTGDFTFNFMDTGPGALVAHVTARGVIDLAGGGHARVFALVRLVVRPDDPLIFDEEQVRLKSL